MIVRIHVRNHLNSVFFDTDVFISTVSFSVRLALNSDARAHILRLLRQLLQMTTELRTADVIRNGRRLIRRNFF